MEPERDRIAGNDFRDLNHCFPKKPMLNDNMDFDRSEEFTPHIITRMPDLTGYGHDTAPQDITLYRPKNGRIQVHLDILKKLHKLSFRKWCAILAILAVAGMIGWSLFHSADSPLAAQKSVSDTLGVENLSSNSTEALETIRSAPSRGVSEYRFDELNDRTSSARTIGVQDNFFSGAPASPVSQNHFGPQSIVPADSTASEMTQYPPGISGVAMVAPDTPSRTLSPWDRQPNPATTIAMANNNTAPHANTAMAAPQAAQYNEYSQNVSPQSTASQNGQFQTTSQQQGFAGMGNEYGYPGNASGMTAGTHPNPGAMPYNPQQNPQYSGPVSHQIADGFGVMPQQVSYQHSPVSHEMAIAANTNNLSSYSQEQGQGQWPIQGQPHNAGYVPQYAATQNFDGNHQYAMQNRQPSHSGNGSQFVPQDIVPPGMSNVPVMTSQQSYRGAGATGTNMTGTVNPYPNPGYQPQQSIQYNSAAASQTMDFYR